MQELIYYPAFEVQDANWLKFALLYIDRLSPIIPESGDQYLTGITRQITQETDLIRAHRPEHREGEAASLDAIDLIDKILKHPRRYSGLFGSKDFLDRWREPTHHRFILFREKYTDYWEQYCLDNHIGSRAGHGIATSRELALIYMSLLAHIISEGTGVPPITDYDNMDRISILTRRASRISLKRAYIARSIVNVAIPANISEIPFERIIACRNKRGFKNHLHAFHSELDSYITQVENGEAKGDFISTRGSAFSEFSDEIVSLSTKVVPLALGIWVLLSRYETGVPFFKELASGTAFVAGSVISIRNQWKHTRASRLTRKYLVNLTKLVNG
jgi:hypothetical protein